MKTLRVLGLLPRTEQRIHERARSIGGGVDAVTAAARSNDGFREDELAIVRRCDSFPSKETAALAAAARNRETVLGRLTAARLTLELRNSATRALYDSLHLPLQLCRFEVGGHLHLGEVPHVAADALEVFAVLSHPPLAHLQHQLHLHRGRKRRENLRVDIISVGDEHVLFFFFIFFFFLLLLLLLLPLVIILNEDKVAGDHGSSVVYHLVVASEVDGTRWVNGSDRSGAGDASTTPAGAAGARARALIERLVEDGGFHGVEEELLSGATHLPLLILAETTARRGGATL